MKKLLLLLLLSAILLPSMAQQRTEAEAEAIAKAFMQNNGYDFNVTKSSKIKKVRTEKAGEITPYFIFNDTQKGGFVIVGGQEGMSDILAYSNDECFDIDDMPPAAKMWLENYEIAAIQAANYPEESKAEKRAAAKAFLNSNFAIRKSVNPLLGEIKFNQGTPYNNQCPILTITTIDGGKESTKTAPGLVGCSATAFGMIMRYWKHPLHANGYKEHTFNYDQIVNKDTEKNTSAKMTVVVDYDKDGYYDWDNMLPTYRSGTTYTEEQAAAVSKLLAHCGIALGAGYGHGGTGAVTDAHKYATYFDYDKNISDIACSKYLDQPELLRSWLADELSQGRPMLCKGSNDPDKYNGHAYVCDGFDMNGLFHFNLGWDGGSNGYYEVAPQPASAAFLHSMTAYINIHPNGRLTPTEPTRRVIFEIGGGDWNKKYKTFKKALDVLDTDKKYGESLICIVTADTEEDAENYLPGLSSIQGFIIDRCDTITGVMSQTNITKSYQAHVNIAAPALIDVDAMYTSDSTMAVTAYTEFNNSFTDADFRIAFTYIEDNAKIDGTTYNHVARGIYPGKEGYENSLPATIEADKQYTYENEIPLPSSINNTEKATLIVMLIDGKTGTIVNANTLELKQINSWKANNKPAFYNEGNILGESSSTSIYDFDEEKSRMEIPVRINNPWFQTMPVEVTAEAIELAENAEIQLGETEGSTTAAYSLKAHDIDSTLMLYLNITDKFQSSQSSVKLTIKQNKNKIAEQIVNFGFIKSVEGTNPYTIRVKGTLCNFIPQEEKDTITTITLGGRLCGNDFIYMRDSLTNLQVIDMSQARIVEGPGEYNGKYTTTDDVVGIRLFQGMNIKKVILPESATIIENYAFNINKNINTVVMGNKVTSIGTSAFTGCTSLKQITIPASVAEIGRYAFKGSAIKCVICKGETPAKLNSQVFSGVDLANATLVVPNETAVATYQATKQWTDFGYIITNDQYTTSIAPVTEETNIIVKDGKIVIENDAEVAIYTFAGKLVATGKAGEYSLPAGNYIVKIGNNAVKVRL